MLKPVGAAKTGPDGKLVFTDELKPNANYVIFEEWQPRVAQPIKSRKDLVSWIDNCILGDLRTLELGMREAQARKFENKLSGGNFLLAAGCCMALEYMSFIYWGQENATENVRRYADRFLTPVNQRYSEISDILWRCFRNGLVHGSWPQPIAYEGASVPLIVVGVGSEMTDEHLAPVPSWRRKSFAVSGPRLLRELEQSLEQGFRKWILEEADDTVLTRGAPRLLEIRSGDREGRRQVELILEWNEQR